MTSINKNWKVVQTLKEVHVTPLQDIKEHGLYYSCLCQPFLRDKIIVHNSYDGREFYEEDNLKNIS